MKKFGLITGVFLIILMISNCTSTNPNEPIPVSKVDIRVDGKIDDWDAVKPHILDSKEDLWIGEGLPEGKWEGKQDLSAAWRIAWNDQKLYFLFEVTDDTLSDFDKEYTWLNDCLEIHLDPENKEGERIPGIETEDPVEARVGKKSFGYEMHFLPTQSPKVYLDDTRSVFYTDSTQNEYFEKSWKGKAVTKYTKDGYLMEMGFDIPGVELTSGKIIGLDIGLCDDDGQGRSVLMVWSRFKGSFWLTMDNFKKMQLQ